MAGVCRIDRDADLRRPPRGGEQVAEQAAQAGVRCRVVGRQNDWSPRARGVAGTATKVPRDRPQQRESSTLAVMGGHAATAVPRATQEEGLQDVDGDVSDPQRDSHHRPLGQFRTCLRHLEHAIQVARHACDPRAREVMLTRQCSGWGRFSKTRAREFDSPHCLGGGSCEDRSLG